jgi:hypothetical protein
MSSAAGGSAVVGLNRVGRIDLRDLTAVSEFHGREFLPYPFMIRDPARRGPSAGMHSAPDRFNHGDLRIFKPWFTTCMTADIRVECNVQYLGADTPSLRILAHRSGESGFLASQKPDDTIEVFTVSPYELGAATAASALPSKPGKQPNIVIPEYIPRRPRPVDDDTENSFAFSVPVAMPDRPARVPEAEVSVYATIQSHWRPARNWGFDRTKDAAVWLRISADGDYLYVPDYSHAKPMTTRGLRDAIDRLIGEDLKQLLQFRRG